VTFTLKVINTGDVALSDVNLSDPMCPTTPTRINAGDNDAEDQLAPGETWTYECILSDVQIDFTNVATVTGLTLNGANLLVMNIDDEPVDVIRPSLSIQKGPSTQTLVTGSDAAFTITVENTGDVLMTDVMVNDNQCGVEEGPLSSAMIR